MAEKTDCQLLREYICGDSQAFETLVNRHQGMVIGVCNRVTGNADYAEDAAQATFLLLASRAGKLQSHPSVAGWLHRSATNIARSANRSAHRRKQREKIAMTESMADEDRALEHKEYFLETLDSALMKLSDQDRECLVLHYIEGISQVDLSRRLKLKESTLAMRLSRARERLLQAFRRQGLGVTGGALLVLLAIPLSASASSAFSTTVIAAGCQMQTTGLAGLTGISPRVMSLFKGIIRRMIVRNTIIGSAAFLVLGTICLAVASPAGRRPDPTPVPRNQGGVTVAVEKKVTAPKVEKKDAKDKIKDQKKIVKEYYDLMSSYNQTQVVDKKDVDKLASYMIVPFTFLKKSRSRAEIRQRTFTKPEELKLVARGLFGQFTVTGGVIIDDIVKTDKAPKLNDKTHKDYTVYEISKRSPVGGTNKMLLYLNDKNKIIAIGGMKYKD